MTTNAAGSAVAMVGYYPFGSTRFATGELTTDKRFTGQRLDQSGLYYYNARYYGAAIGRFISADSATPDYKDPQDLSPYAYCRNNPLKYTDPTGEFWGVIGYLYRVVEPVVIRYVLPRVLDSFKQPGPKPPLTQLRPVVDAVVDAYECCRNNP